MKVAAYQAPLDGSNGLQAIPLIREQIDRCESLGVSVLCCPEGILGGLADYAAEPNEIAIGVTDGTLNRVLAPLTSDRVTTIVGFTEIDSEGHLYNSAAVFARETVGVYRKLHPAINRSVYRAGHELPVFTVGGLTFGILICRDSTFPDSARAMVSRGARALFIPTNNGMPPAKGGPELVGEARSGDIARARESRVSVIRADVAGVAGNLVSHGASGIVNQAGVVLGEAPRLATELVIAEIETRAAE
jgi:predicted amidohydrolase